MVADSRSPYRFKELHQKVTNLAWAVAVKRFVIVAASSIILFLLLHFIFPLPDRVSYSTMITDKKGNLLHAYLTPDEKWRMKTDLHEISPLLRKTIVAKEDRYFFSHPGINVFAMARAGFNNLVSGRRTSGASTITMQVARSLSPRKRTVAAKLIEMFRALQLELKYSKKEILQLYLNLVPYGGNIEGVKAAAYLYFQKSPDHLSLAEITALSIIPNRPSSLVIGKNNDLIVQERNKWLRRFAADGVFSKKEIEDALAEPLLARRQEVPRLIPHLAYRLKSSFNTHSITATIDRNTQLKIEKLTADYVRTLSLNNINNAAVMVMDNQTRDVIAYVGSQDFYDSAHAGQVNGVAAIRQPGSTLKPLLYGLCMDEGLLTPKMTINDVPVNYSGYAPENYDQKFHGAVTLEYALEHSLNIPSVKMLQQLGKDKLIHRLSLAGFRQVAKDQNKLGLSMILGGCGTSLEELTGLFSAFANNGNYRAPRFVDAPAAGTPTQVLSPAAAFMVTTILSKISRPDFPLNWQATEHMPKIAWKTGTSYGRRDAWSIGYNQRFTVGVWVGNFSGTAVAELSGANTATPLLFKIFNSIDYDGEAAWFAPPADCSVRKVCSESGFVPGAYCTNLVTDFFIPLVSHSKACQHVQEYKTNPEGTISYCNSCAPASGYTKRFLPTLAPELQEYYRVNNIAFQKIPPHNAGCEQVFKGDGPSIKSPTEGTEYYIDKNNPEPLQMVAATAGDVSRVYWYINNRFYQAAATGTKTFFVPDEGPVKISCTDDKGRNRDIWIKVRYAEL